MDRRPVLLKDVADLTVGYVGPMAAEYQADGVPFLRSLNVRPHRIDMEDVKYVDRAFHEKLAKSALRPGDVVTVRTGKPGQTAVIPNWLAEANCSDLVVTRPGPDLDARWLSYYLNWITDSHIAGHLVGAVQQHFNVRSAEAIRLDLPSRLEQRAIAEVLGALDDKIAANSRVIAAATNLAVGVLAVVSARAPIAELARHRTQASRPESFVEGVRHFSLPAFDSGRMPEVASAGAIKSNKFRLERPAVLMSKLNPRIPRIWNVLSVPEPMAVASTEFVVLEPREVSTSVLWAALSQQWVSVEVAGKVAGTSGSHQRVKPSELLDVLVPDVRSLPPALVSEIEASCVSAEALRAESTRLARTRGELLPLLMSGKLRVSDAERAGEGVL